MNGISHPQALQILKQCGSNAKLILFREKSKDNEILEQLPPNMEAQNMSRETTHRCNALPGSIGTDSRQVVTRPPFRRKVTSGSGFSGLSIPQLEDEHTATSYDINLMQEQDKSLNNQLNIHPRSDDESERSSNRSIAAVTPKYIAVNERTDAGPFMIEIEKMFKSLGLQVMMDEVGECYISDISPNGLVAKCGQFR